MGETVKDAVYWKSKYDDLEKEMEEFRESSTLLEKELESSLEQAEKTIKELRLKNNKVQFDYDGLKDKLSEVQKKTEAQIRDLEEDASQCHKREEEYIKYIRELEQKNDDLERAQRATITSLGEFEIKLNSALERNVLLESELDEKELLKGMVQRLKDETRDLKQEIEVKGKTKTPSAEKSRVCDSNKIETETSIPNGIPKNMNGVTRVTATSLVSELLRTVGILESKLAMRNQREHTSGDTSGLLRRSRLNRGGSSPSINNMEASNLKKN